MITKETVEIQYAHRKWDGLNSMDNSKKQELSDAEVDLGYCLDAPLLMPAGSWFTIKDSTIFFQRYIMREYV